MVKSEKYKNIILSQKRKKIALAKYFKSLLHFSALRIKKIK